MRYRLTRYTSTPLASRQVLPSDHMGFFKLVSKIIVPASKLVALGLMVVEYGEIRSGPLTLIFSPFSSNGPRLPI